MTQDERDRRLDEAAEVVRKRLAEMIEEAGGYVVLIDVRRHGNRINQLEVETIGFLSNGLGGKMKHKMTIQGPKRAWRSIAGETDHAADPRFVPLLEFVIPCEEDLRRITEARFARHLEHQARIGGRRGRASVDGPDQVDLSQYVVEAPLWRWLQDKLPGDEREFLRSAIHSQDIVSSMATRRNGQFFGLLEDVRVETKRGAVRARIPLTPDIAWSKGTVTMRRMQLPDTVVATIRSSVGEPLRTLIEHPYLDDDIKITGITADQRDDGKTTYSITTVGSEMSIPD